MRATARARQLATAGLMAATVAAAGATPANEPVGAPIVAPLATAVAAPENGRVLAVCADPSNLPMSNQREEGYENRIAQLLARDLHATVHYTWNLQRRSFLRRTLQAHACDVVIGVPTGLPGLVTSRPYYTSSYVAVTARAHTGWQGFDDPALRRQRIGLQALGAEGANTPPASALARRGIVDHIVGFPMWGPESDETPSAHIVDAVAAGDVDVALVWGPFAGYFAKRHGDRLALTPVTADPAEPDVAFSYPMSVGVRRGDDALLAELQAALDRHREEIQAVLRDDGVPLVAAR
jgi:quinoprotein dehydrogenase-associated probable ABC transporter substrate-binding protein